MSTTRYRKRGYLSFLVSCYSVDNLKKSRTLVKMAHFLCTFCPNIYEDKDKYNRHIKNVHDEKIVKCEECNEEFSSKRALNNHRKMQKTQEYSCEQCQYKTRIK